MERPISNEEKRPEDEVEGQRDGIFYKQLKGITKSYNTVNALVCTRSPFDGLLYVLLLKNQFQLFNVTESI